MKTNEYFKICNHLKEAVLCSVLGEIAWTESAQSAVRKTSWGSIQFFLEVEFLVSEEM